MGSVPLHAIKLVYGLCSSTTARALDGVVPVVLRDWDWSVEGEGRWLGVEGVDGLLFAHCECVKGVWGLGWLIVNGLNGLDGRSGTEFRAFL